MPSSGDIVVGTDVELEGISIGMISKVTQSSNGTVTSGSTETRDAVLGSVVFVVASAQAATTYKVTLSGCGLNYGAGAGDRFTCNFRDGGAATPTATSTAVGVNFNIVNTATSSAGVQAGTFSTTYVPGTGTHTIGVFFVRTVGSTATATPVGAREFFVEAMGG